MIKLLLLCLLASVSLASPFQRFEIFDDLENEAEIVDAAIPLPGTGNLHEKRLPVIRLAVPTGYLANLYGRKNLAERAQIPEQYNQLPGVRNLEEKAIPDQVIARLKLADEQFEVEKV